ncbi:RNA-binding protein [Bacillus infantis]|uniref:YlmH family RNA-binding protein n=1 Tax=Bacillus infantis TaxID=324767 RepID=UPI00101D6644|nr:RNA-binding protein [Bacillus infantis]RYI32207.1 RNA-binding protein [Bacillus infantis]
MSIYQHFRPEEKEFIDQSLGWKDYVETSYAPKLTDFLDPREQQIVKMIVGEHSGVKLRLFGGTEGTERKRALLYPEYFTPDEEEFSITLFEINYPSKFVSIEHPQILGSLMALGLKRGKFGDITVQDERAQFFVSREIEDYVSMQLESIGKASVTLKKLPLEKAITAAGAWEESSASVSSLRLDAVISAIYNISRQKSQLFVLQGLVKVNWGQVEDPSFVCGEADVLSVRGKGRSKIIEVEGKTKKDKWRIITGKQK